MSIIFQTTFPGSATLVGAAGSTTGAADTASVGSSGHLVDISGGQYKIDGSGNLVNLIGGGWQNSSLIYNASGTLADCAVSAIMQHNASGSSTGQEGLQFVLRSNGTGTMYWVDWIYGTGQVSIRQVINGALVQLGTDAPSGITNNNAHRYKGRASVTGMPATVSLSIYDLDGGAPTVPLFTYTQADTTGNSIASGLCGLNSWSNTAIGQAAISELIIENLASALAPGVITETTLTDSSVTLALSSPSGGNGSISQKLWASEDPLFVPGDASSRVVITTTSGAGGSGTDTPSAALPESGHYYIAQATDSNSPTPNVANGTMFEAVLLPQHMEVKFIGDSITNRAGSLTTFIAQVAALDAGRIVTVNNQGNSGQTSTTWRPDNASGLFTAALVAFGPASVTNRFVHLMLGPNDAKAPVVSKATYKANMSAICDGLIAVGYKCILSEPTFVVPGTAGAFDNTAPAALRSYSVALDELCDGVNKFPGARRCYQTYANNADVPWTEEGIHPLPGIPEEFLETDWALAFIRAVRGYSTTISGGGMSFPTITPSITTQTVLQSITFTTGQASTMGVTVTDQYGNILLPRITTPTESTGVYTISVPGFDPSRSGFFVWDNSGVVIAKTPFQGPRLTSHQPAPSYKPQFPIVGH